MTELYTEQCCQQGVAVVHIYAYMFLFCGCDAKSKVHKKEEKVACTVHCRQSTMVLVFSSRVETRSNRDMAEAQVSSVC